MSNDIEKGLLSLRPAPAGAPHAHEAHTPRGTYRFHALGTFFNTPRTGRASHLGSQSHQAHSVAFHPKGGGPRQWVGKYSSLGSARQAASRHSAKMGKSMQSTHNHEESFMSFEEIFKSEHEETYESCGQTIEKGLNWSHPPSQQHNKWRPLRGTMRPGDSLWHHKDHGSYSLDAGHAGATLRYHPNKGKAHDLGVHTGVSSASRAVASHHAKMGKPKMPKMGKSMQSTPNHEESFMPFEEIFKSEHEETCESCGQTIEKGMKHKKGKKHGTAHKIGNEMDPHRGKPSGSVFVGPSRGGYKAGAVDREHSKKPHAPASGVVKAMFPVSAAPQLAVYDGLGDDAALAQNIEASLTPGMAHNLFVPSARNLAVENEQGLAQDE